MLPYISFKQNAIVFVLISFCISFFCTNSSGGLSCGRCQRLCLVGGKFLCLMFGIAFWPIFDLFVRRKNKGPHYGLFAVCEWLNISLSLKATLSHVLTVHGKQTNNHAVFPRMELIYNTQLMFINCFICQVLILHLESWVWLRWDIFVHSRRLCNATKINHMVALSLCALYRVALLVPLICDSTKEL